MKVSKVSKNSNLYTKLLNHCKKQYKDILTIEKAYLVNGQVFGIDYLNTKNINSIACNTFEADKIICFS